MPLGKMDKGEEEEELPTNCRAHISLSGSYGTGGAGITEAVAYDEHCTLYDGGRLPNRCSKVCFFFAFSESPDPQLLIACILRRGKERDSGYIPGGGERERESVLFGHLGAVSEEERGVD